MAGMGSRCGAGTNQTAEWTHSGLYCLSQTMRPGHEPLVVGAFTGSPYDCTHWTWPGDPDGFLERDTRDGHELWLERLDPDGCTERS